ncbi:MAG: DegT/DnrJ/EryC1/StrS family aminotransferase, partial [Bacteroidales bacterium]|nr:DegT/DnrJ/EryC1/StrS family aminotransferase [Bacteroidales bacterium]
ILTTSGNFYISSCVTKEIEKFCKWSREFVPESRIIFVNHEFGYPFPDLIKLKEFNLPIIEDCAGAFFSIDKDKTIGEVGDFVIYSLPKMFPLQVGGLLVTKQIVEEGSNSTLDPFMLQYIKNVLSEYMSERDEIVRKRIENYLILKESFLSLGFREQFPLDDCIVPNVFMFRTNNSGINLPELKKYFWAHGIQCSVFYGEEAFFIPVHQALTEIDLRYFYEVMRSFINLTKE